mmetsp:Transcript_25063/g.37872  ORF Transcript_25063/g.37872 Transcript_25063/m.37872 type:complete len:96 (+) Transcript_25063:1-288(+)
MYGVSLGLTPTPTGISEVDPKLVLGSNSLYRPDASMSPCIDNAQGHYPFVDRDMDGQSRPMLHKDVGADEVSGDQGVSRPFGENDVGGLIGPSWW